MKALLQLIPGLLFGAGLAISGMTDPAKVRGFLDVAGPWDPSLAFVMVGAIGVFSLLNLAIHRRQAPLCSGALPGPRSASPLTKNVAIGAALFGAGWGLSGVCPGPALANLSLPNTGILVFVGAMLAGMVLAQRFFGADAPPKNTAA